MQADMFCFLFLFFRCPYTCKTSVRHTVSARGDKFYLKIQDILYTVQTGEFVQNIYYLPHVIKSENMHKKSLINYAKRPKDTQTEYIFKKNEKNF